MRQPRFVSMSFGDQLEYGMIQSIAEKVKGVDMGDFY